MRDQADNSGGFSPARFWIISFITTILIIGCSGDNDDVGAGQAASDEPTPTMAMPTETGNAENSAPDDTTATREAGDEGTPDAAEATPEDGSDGAGEPLGFTVETLGTGLIAPWEIVFLPDGRMLVTERPGHVRMIENDELLPEPIASLPDVEQQGEGGLLGMALHPEFETNNWVYLYYSYLLNDGLANQVVRYTFENNSLETPQTIIDGIPGAYNHNGGRIAFGPYGLLYITTGDANEAMLAQDLDSLAGKILRLNDDGSIPDDNPFDSAVYSYGHRNPQGLAWDPETGDLYATEHGPSANDEVNRIEAGNNYGWPHMYGFEGEENGFTPPVMTAGPDWTWAPSGAEFVDSDLYPQWQGDFLFVGLRGASLWREQLPPEEPIAPDLDEILDDRYGRLRNVVESPDGYLYVLTNNKDGRGNPAVITEEDDRVLRLVPENN